MADDSRSGHTVRGRAPGDPDRHAPRQWIYENLTPWRIHARFTAAGELVPRTQGDDGADEPPGSGPPCEECVVRVLSIPALGEVKVPREDALLLNTLHMRRLGQIEVRPAPSELLTNLPRAIVIFGWLVVLLLFGGWALLAGGASSLPWEWVVASVVVVPVIALAVAAVREIQLYRRFSRYRAESGEMARGAVRSGSGRRSLEGIERGSRIRAFVDGVPRHAAEVAIFVGAIVVSVVGLGMAIHLTTQLNDLLPVDYGALLRLDNPFVDVSEVARNSPAFWQLVVGHVAQWILVSVAAFTPVAMYFQFDRQRLASVERRWVQEVFRLDPTVRTVRDIRAPYGSQIDSSFGNLGPDSGLTLRRGRRSPVIVATILLALGWFLVISTTQVPDLVEVPVDPATVVAGEGSTELVWSTEVGSGGADDSFPVSTFFRPQLTLVGYAFLGSYVFALLHVLRGYQRRDLHPKAYNTVTVRILAAYALALVVGVAYDGPAAEVTMFFVGFMPQSALVWLKEKLSVNDGVWGVVPLHEPAPLTDLEGIDLYDRTRLDEEGIANIHNLAHADIVELMSSTRISAAQLVDWTDQAILYLRVGGDAMARQQKGSRAGAEASTVAEGGGGSGSEPFHPPDVRRNLCHLRSYGIRTASDLVQAYEQALRRGRERAGRELGDVAPAVRVAEYEAAEVDALRAALDLPDAPQRAGVRTIQTIIDTLPDEEWFVQVRNWRNPEFGAVDAWYSYLDGHDWNLTRSTQVPDRVTQAKLPLSSVALVQLPVSGNGHVPPEAVDAPSTEPAVPVVADAIAAVSSSEVPTEADAAPAVTDVAPAEPAGLAMSATDGPVDVAATPVRPPPVVRS